MFVLFFPGRNKPVKSYQCYFPNLTLVTDPEDKRINVNTILCHSRGIEMALQFKDRPIVAMDPSVFDTKLHDKCTIFLNQTRKDEFADKTAIIFYQQDTHYPYMNRQLRNKIVACLL